MELMDIRLVKIADIHELVDLAYLLYQESPHYRKFAFSPGRTAEYLGMCAAAESHRCWVAVHDGVIIGFLSAAIGDMDWFNDRVVEEKVVYIRPEHRGKRRGAEALLRLIAEMMEWGQVNNAHVQAGVSTQINNPAVARFYKRLGMQPHGELFFAECP